MRLTTLWLLNLVIIFAIKFSLRSQIKSEVGLFYGRQYSYLRLNFIMHSRKLITVTLNQFYPSKSLCYLPGDFDSLITLYIYVASLELCYQQQYVLSSVYKDLARICQKGWDSAFCLGYRVCRVSARSVYNKRLGRVSGETNLYHLLRLPAFKVEYRSYSRANNFRMRWIFFHQHYLSNKKLQ